MRFKKIFLSLLFFILTILAKAQTVDEVIAKYIAFTGGMQSWKKIKTLITSETYNYNGVVFPFKSYSKAPNLYKYIVPFKGKYFEHAYDGKTGRKIDAFKGEKKKTVLTGKEAFAMANEADVELESPFVDYESKGHTATMEGSDTINGKPCYKIRLVKNGGDTALCYFGNKSCMPVKKQAASKNAELHNAMLDTFYSD